MDLKKFNNLLNRYFRGRANETEKALIDAWYRSYGPEESKILLSEAEKEQVRASIQKSIQRATGRPVKTRRIVLYRIAASFVLFSVIGLLYYSLTKSAGEYYSVNTSTGKLEKVILPDSSVAWLNSVSHLRIQSAFNKPQREVFLEEGEAFFEVKKNAAQPFIVHTGELDIQVLGTSFNVRSYKTAAEVKVSVSTGRVAISLQHRQLAILTPDQELTYDRKTGKYVQATINAMNAQAWKDGNLYLHQASFRQLALVLRNTYGITLTSEDPVIRNYQFTLRLRSDLPLEEILKLVQSIHNTNYRKEHDVIILY